MDRKQKVTSLIIEYMIENQEIEYQYNGSVTTMDPNVISLEFVAKKAGTRGEFNLWGMIDVPLNLKAQYDNRSLLNDFPLIQRQIQEDLTELSVKINRLL